MPKKIGKPTTQRMAILKNQVSHLLWFGKIQTTLDRAKSVSRMAEKLLTAAINSYDDTTKVTKDRIDAKGKTVSVELINDGPKKLAARRKIMSKVYDIKEVKGEEETEDQYKARTKMIKHPLIEKIFNELAPKYAERAKELKQGGGYTRILKLGARKGDAAEAVILELI